MCTSVCVHVCMYATLINSIFPLSILDEIEGMSREQGHLFETSGWTLQHSGLAIGQILRRYPVQRGEKSLPTWLHGLSFGQCLCLIVLQSVH